MKRIIKNALRPVLSPFRPGNIVMFHIGRCGSTVLTSLLRQHTRVFWTSEFYVRFFREWEQGNEGKEVAGEMPGDAIKLLKESMQDALHRYYGFEVKPFHLRLIGYSMESFLENLERLGFTHYILLDRKNRLRKIISSLIAHHDRMKYHQEGKSRSDLNKILIDLKNVAIDFDEKPLITFLEDYDREVTSLRARIESKQLLSLTYEDHIQEDPRIGYRLICEFIGIEPKDVTVKLSRTNPFPVKQMIENFEEVESVLKGTKYEWMLYD